VNVTLELEDDLVTRVREVARRQGTTLNELVRRHLEMIAGRTTGGAVAEELRRLWAEHPGHSGGRRISREDAYEEQL
jgi:hypothetical protein